MTAQTALWRMDDDGGPPPTGPFVALVPGDIAVVHIADLPTRVRGAARAGIARRQLADRLSLTPGAVEMHAVAGGGWSHVVVIGAERMAALRDRVAPTGGRCQAIMPDYFALPSPEDGWILHVGSAGDVPRMTARLSPRFGFSAPLPLAMEVLRLSDPKPARIDVYGPLSDDARRVLDAFGAPVNHKTGAPPVAQAKGDVPVDLREDHAAIVRRIAAGLRRWRLTAALVLLTALAWPAAEWLRMQRAEAGLRAATMAAERVLRDTFIPTGPILDARAQVGRIVAAAAAGQEDTPTDADALALFQRAAQVMLAAGADVQSVSHVAGQGLSITLDVPSFAALDVLLADLRAGGLRVSVPQSAATVGGQTRAMLRVGPV